MPTLRKAGDWLLWRFIRNFWGEVGSIPRIFKGMNKANRNGDVGWSNQTTPHGRGMDIFWNNVNLLKL